MAQLLTVLATCVVICVFGRIKSQELHVPAEKGQPLTLECSFASPTKSVAWKLLDVGNQEVTLSTCTTTSCTDQQPQNYTGHISGSSGIYKSTLDVFSVSVDKTQFKCFRDTGNMVANISIEVYVMASTPSCRQSLVVNKYVDVMCMTDNVYPNLQGVLHRREPGKLMIDGNATLCSHGQNGSGSKGDRNGQCTWRVLFGSLQEVNTFYVEFFPVVWNHTVVDRPAVSPNLSLSFSVPRVEIYTGDCPVGPGVIGGHIQIGTNATCKCEISETGLVTGRARWFKKDETVIGDEDSNGQFSILTLVYNASDPNAEYDCRAVNPSSTYHHLTYKPHFTSSAPRSLISGVTLAIAAILASMVGHACQRE